ncbi:MAG: hypothetical protein AUI15_35545 [Actinobacteria bacterium 13_2_20CM_2_66_6]|nr:MAG: hypothetical protein AUI15_35545 [Actinobacteria bacterium 13_2_20CM_2_66_6]
MIAAKRFLAPGRSLVDWAGFLNVGILVAAKRGLAWPTFTAFAFATKDLDETVLVFLGVWLLSLPLAMRDPS